MSVEGMTAEREDAPVILIVEDERDLAELYATGLGESYAVRTAFDGEEALERLDDNVDVVLLDRRMPGLSGDEVLDRIRERGFDCRVVMVSAVEPDFDVLEMGFDDYVSKPVSAGDLRETVDRMLELATHDSALQEYHALVSKKFALEAKKSLRELHESDEYAELNAEIERRREELDEEHADAQEALASAAVFRDLDTSDTPTVPPSDGDEPGSAIADPMARPGAPNPSETNQAVADADEPTAGGTRSDDGTPSDDDGSDRGAEASDGEDPADGTADLKRGPSDGDAQLPLGGAGPAEALFEAVPDPVLIEGSDGTVVDVNPAFTERFGHAPEPLIGEPIAALFADSEQVESVDERLADLEGRPSVRAAVDVRAEDGTTIAGAASVGDRRNAAGDVVARVWVIRPNESVVERDPAIDSVADELAVFHRLLRHDVYNDMAIVSGWLERLREELTPDQRETLDRAIAATDHTIELTAAVGDLVSTIDEPETLDLERLSLPDVVHREVEKVRDSYEAATIEAEELPEVKVQANDLLGSVVGNLLHNAIQHNDADEPQVVVSIDVGFHTATLKIADNGPGIDEAVRETLYERAGTNAETGGLGIGLSLVRRLVDAYDGSIEIGDNEPRGTVVSVELRKAE